MNAFLQSALMLPIENLVNAIIAGDDHLTAQAVRFKHKRVEIVAHKPELTLHIEFHAGSLSLSPADPDSDVAPDARVEGSSEALLALLLQKPEQRPLANPSLTLSGDVLLIQDLYRCAQDLDLEWEDYLAPLAGDVITDGLSNLFSQGRSLMAEAHQSMRRNLRDYLTEETRASVDIEEGIELRARLDALRLRLDRAAARAQRLQQLLSQ